MFARLHIGLALCIILAGCAPGAIETAAPLVPTSTPQPAAQALSREAAVDHLIEQVILPGDSHEWADAYGLPEPLPEDTEVWAYRGEESVWTTEPTWLFWVDDLPEAMFAHPTRLVLIGVQSRELTALPALWWPVVDGEHLWANVEERLDSPHNVYRGPYAFSDPSLHPEEEPQANAPGQAWPVLALAGPPLRGWTSLAPKTGTAYAILVAGDEGPHKRTVELVLKHLKDVEKVDPANIELLNPAKSAGEIANAFDRIRRRIKTGDTLIFYYAGHGTREMAVISKAVGGGDSFWYDLVAGKEMFSIRGKKQVQSWVERLNHDPPRIEIDMLLKLQVPREVAKDCKVGRKEENLWEFTLGKGSRQQNFRVSRESGNLVVYKLPKNVPSRNSLAYNLQQLPPGVRQIVILQACKSGSAIDLLKGNNIKALVLTSADKNSPSFNQPGGYCDFSKYLVSSEGKGTKKGDWEKGFSYAKGMIGGKSYWYSTLRGWISQRFDTKPQYAVIPATVAKEELEVVVFGITAGKQKPLQGATVKIEGRDLAGKQHTILGQTMAQGVFKTTLPRSLAYTITVSYKDCGTGTAMTPILHREGGGAWSIIIRLTCKTLAKPAPPQELAKPEPAKTPTTTPPPTFTPAPQAGDYAQQCTAYLDQGRPLLIAHDETGEGDCAKAIQLLQMAVEQATIALEIEPGHAAACFCRGMSRRTLEQDLEQAIQDLECALQGVEGERRAEAERALAELREIVAAPVCVSMGPLTFAEDWDGDQPIGPDTTFPANQTREVWAQWPLSSPCGEVALVKWYHDGQHKCQHHTEPLEDWWDYYGSGWVTDEEWIEEGEWCVSVFLGDMLMTEGCFSIE